MACALLGQNVMVTAAFSTPASPVPFTDGHPSFADPRLSFADRRQVLRFAASFLWADLEVADAERRFLTDLARELDVNDEADVAGLLSRPPVPEDVDPTSVPPAVADAVRHAALRAIAADGRVGTEEMRMFELLDDLLPRSAA